MSLSLSEEDRDHRNVAQRLDLLHFQDEAPGMVFWHPGGFALLRVLEEAARRQAQGQGYAEVRTPQLLRRPVWEASGHWQHFQSGLFRVEDQSVPAAIKPVSCPGHMYLVARRPPSYRELPLRLAELGQVHRDEPGGTLHGLLRLRQFTQDDGHIFCTEEQAEEEVLRFSRSVPEFYRAFGFDQVGLALSTRPAERAGDDALWDRAEAALQSVLRRLGVPFTVQPGAGAFYGPKLEWVVPDRTGRPWQCGTIQFDLVLPGRFDVRYVDAEGKRRPPVMLHRALYGSLERFLGLVLERHGVALAPWLAPVQVALLPVSEGQAAGAAEWADRLRARGLRVNVQGEQSLSRRIVECHERGIPLVAVIGPRELAAGTLALRGEGGRSTELGAEQAVAELVRRCQEPLGDPGQR